MNFGRNKKKHLVFERAVSSNVTATVLIIVVALLGNATWNVYCKYADARVKEERAKQELTALVARVEVLNDDIGRLQTDAGREEEIRKRYGVAKPGERMVVLVDDTKNNAAVTTEKSSWFGSLWANLFKKK
ncbi:MAG: hypothetical protein HGA67_03100 [Candidatus Yonathbacteria bacterium]|nr:hypothetical protein [Candidatus Yonathbacteria bacterium]